MGAAYTYKPTYIERNTLSQRLRAALAEVGMTQHEFAQKLNLSDTTVSYWLSKGEVPGTGNIIKVSKLLNISIDYMYGQTDNPSVNIRSDRAEEERRKLLIENAQLKAKLYSIKCLAE